MLAVCQHAIFAYTFLRIGHVLHTYFITQQCSYMFMLYSILCIWESGFVPQGFFEFWDVCLRMLMLYLCNDCEAHKSCVTKVEFLNNARLLNKCHHWNWCTFEFSYFVYLYIYCFFFLYKLVIDYWFLSNCIIFSILYNNLFGITEALSFKNTFTVTHIHWGDIFCRLSSKLFDQKYVWILF